MSTIVDPTSFCCHPIPHFLVEGARKSVADPTYESQRRVEVGWLIPERESAVPTWGITEESLPVVLRSLLLGRRDRIWMFLKLIFLHCWCSVLVNVYRPPIVGVVPWFVDVRVHTRRPHGTPMSSALPRRTSAGFGMGRSGTDCFRKASQHALTLHGRSAS